MIAVDTNVLIYAHDSRDLRKQTIAVETINSVDNGVLLWQVACEYLWASRKLEQQGYSYAAAYADIEELSHVWEMVCPTHGVLRWVETLRTRGFSHWDGLLVGACLEAGIDTLISEDFRDIKIVDELKIVNPFV